MKAIVLTVCLLLAACESQAVSTSTPTCNDQLGTDWAQPFGSPVESDSNLDSDRCAKVQNVWCCAL